MGKVLKRAKDAAPITISASVLVAVIALTLTLVWRDQQEARSEKEASIFQSSRDTEQDVKIERNTEDIFSSEEQHSQDIAEIRQEFKDREASERKRHEQIIRELGEIQRGMK